MTESTLATVSTGASDCVRVVRLELNSVTLEMFFTLALDSARYPRRGAGMTDLTIVRVSAGESDCVRVVWLELNGVMLELSSRWGSTRRDTCGGAWV